jgi:hypothetical protein
MLILVGFTWGMGIGTGIAFAGTLFGEVITYWYVSRLPRYMLAQH